MHGMDTFTFLPLPLPLALPLPLPLTLATSCTFTLTLSLSLVHRYASNHVEVVAALLQPKITSLSANVQSICMQNVLKIFVHAVKPTTIEGADEAEEAERSEEVHNIF